MLGLKEAPRLNVSGVADVLEHERSRSGEVALDGGGRELNGTPPGGGSGGRGGGKKACGTSPGLFIEQGFDVVNAFRGQAPATPK
jgi:hypothetical protein